MATMPQPPGPPPLGPPQTSPPAFPSPPTLNMAMNSPGGRPVQQDLNLTQQEIDQATQDELEAQKQDMEDAKAEEQASYEAMGALEGAFVPHGIFRHRGAGPLQYETKRGLIKVFSGDLVCHLHGPSNPEAPEADWELEDDWIVVSEAVLTALLFTVDPKLFPESLEYRAGRIGEERRNTPPPPEADAQSKEGPDGETDPSAAKNSSALGKDERRPLGPHQESGIGGGRGYTPGGDRLSGAGEPPSRNVQSGGVIDRFPGSGKEPAPGGGKGEPASEETQTGGTQVGEDTPKHTGRPEPVKYPAGTAKPGTAGSFGPGKSPANMDALRAMPHSGPAWGLKESVTLGDGTKARWAGNNWVIAV